MSNNKQKLKPCPCGKTPGNLQIILTQGTKWMDVLGDCCSEWTIEARTHYEREGSDDLYALAVAAWNSSPRGWEYKVIKVDDENTGGER